MVFRRKKTSVIDQKLNDIDREIALINREIKGLDRSHRAKASTSSLSKPRQNQSLTTGRQTGQYNEPTASRRKEANPEIPQKTSAESETGNPIQRAVSKTDRLEKLRDKDSSENRDRDKFVSYFAAGHFHDLRPTRHNANVLRNKAIMMAILALLVAFGLLFHFLGN